MDVAGGRYGFRPDRRRALGIAKGLMDVELRLAGCLVRSLRTTDAESMAAHANDRRIWAQLRDRFPHPYSVADAEFFIDLINREDPCTTFAIVVDELCVGGIGLERQHDVHRLTAELGYWLGVDYWGRGIATEAISAVTKWAFDALSLKRVFAQPFADNRGSCRALEKAGFTLEGTLRHSAIKDGVLRDQVMYARLS
jgi:RimJ/RimL family protein N-acetyltransferase